MNLMMDTKVVCKQHPFNNPQQGVCSSCLAEKLSNLSSSTPCIYNYPNSSSSSSKSHIITKSTQVGAANDSFSCLSSGNVSPRAHRRHARHGSDSTTVMNASNGGGGGLKKSRSMIAYASRKGREVGGRSGKMMVKKKGGSGFWAKLIRSTSKRTKDVFTHSRSNTCQQRFDMSHVN